MKDSPLEFITKGSHVEVSSEEEGFSGVWFEATVITPIKKKKKSPTHKEKVYIEYKTLCSDENLECPLRELVDVLFVRPLPPLIEENLKERFELYDVVDAFFKDGWWTGVVTRVFGGGRFLVTFENPFDELVFGCGDLRLHVDWVDGAWVRPEKKKLLGLMFREGKEVEVLLKIKHNQDVWYPAIVVANHEDSSFWVMYKALKEGTEETGPQKVSVDCSQIRPRPPTFKDRGFYLLEKVDVFHEFGWWAGLVTKELPDNRYTVFFQSMKREREFDHVGIRPQLNWKDGKWLFASSQEEVIPYQENGGGFVDNELNDISSKRTCKTKVNSKGKKMERKARISSSSKESNTFEILSNNSPCTPKGVLVGTNLEETEFPSSGLGKNQNDHMDLDHEKFHEFASSAKTVKHTMKITTHLEEKLKRGVGDVTPYRTSSQQNTAMGDEQNGRISCSGGSRPSNIPGDNIVIDLTSDDQHSDNPSLGTRTPKKWKTKDTKENHMRSSRRKRGKADEEGNTGFTKGAAHVELASGRKKADIPFILGLECCKLSASKERKTHLNNSEECSKLEEDQEKHINDLPEKDKGVSCGLNARKTHLNNGEEFLKLEGDQKKQLIDLPEQEKWGQSEAAKSSSKRKRGRPRKFSAGSVDAELTGTGSLLPPESSLIPVSDCMKLVDAQLYCRNDSASTIRKSFSRMPTDSNDQALISEHKMQTYKKAKRRTTSKNNISQISDSSDGTGVKTAKPVCINGVIRTVQQEPVILDDQPLSSWFEKNHTSAPGDSIAMAVEQSIEIRQTRKEVNGQTTFADDNRTAIAMSEDVDAQSRVRMDSDTMLEQCVELSQSRKELNGQNISAKDNKTMAVIGEEVHGQNTSAKDTMLEQCVELSQSRKELNGQNTSANDNKTMAVIGEEVHGQSRVLVDGDTSITTTSEPELPFVKHSSLWKAIESLEALHKMPQKPHFRPLQEYKESSREGLAVALMVNFASAVEKISMLRFDDTKETIADILDSLKDLEGHGFGVQVLRDRVAELESIKENHTKLQEEVDAINAQIVSCKFVKFDKDKEIDKVKKQMKKLQERIAKAESIKQTKELEIAVLESRRQEAEETIGSSRSRYEGLASGAL